MPYTAARSQVLGRRPVPCEWILDADERGDEEDKLGVNRWFCIFNWCVVSLWKQQQGK